MFSSDTSRGRNEIDMSRALMQTIEVRDLTVPFGPFALLQYSLIS